MLDVRYRQGSLRKKRVGSKRRKEAGGQITAATFLVLAVGRRERTAEAGQRRARLLHDETDGFVQSVKQKLQADLSLRADFLKPIFLSSTR